MRGIFLSAAWCAALDSLPTPQVGVAWQLIARLNHHAETGRRELAKAAGVSLRQVNEAVAALVRAGLVVAVPGDGRRPGRLDVRGIADMTERRGSLESDASDGDDKSNSAGRSPRRITSGSPTGSLATDGELASRGSLVGSLPDPSISTSSTGNPQGDDATTVDESPSARARLSETARVTLTEPYSEVHPDPGSSSTPAADPLSLSGADLKGVSDAKRSGPGATEKTAAPKKRSARSLALDELPPAAVALADEFRAYCIAEQPWHHTRKAEPWATHATRLQWARELAALVEGQSDGPLDAVRVHSLIRRMLAWLRTDQGVRDPRYRVIVLSPATLREKWDRIAARVVAAPARVAAGGEQPVHPTSDRRLATAPPPRKGC